MWKAAPFECELAHLGEECSPLPDLSFRLTQDREGWTIDGKLLNVQCTFCSFPLDGSKVQGRFNFLSIRDVDLKAKVTVISP